MRSARFCEGGVVGVGVMGGVGVVVVGVGGGVGGVAVLAIRVVDGKGEGRTLLFEIIGVVVGVAGGRPPPFLYQQPENKNPEREKIRKAETDKKIFNLDLLPSIIPHLKILSGSAANSGSREIDNSARRRLLEKGKISFQPAGVKTKA